MANELTVKPLTDTQREKVLAFFGDPSNKGRGYTAALAAAGVAYGNTQPIAKATIKGDTELYDAFLNAQGLSEAKVLTNIAEIANKEGDPHRLRANMWAANVFHNLRESKETEAKIEHSGEVKFVVESAFPDVIDGSYEEADIDDGDAGPPALPR